MPATCRKLLAEPATWAAAWVVTCLVWLAWRGAADAVRGVICSVAA